MRIREGGRRRGKKLEPIAIMEWNHYNNVVAQ